MTKAPGSRHGELFSRPMVPSRMWRSIQMATVYSFHYARADRGRANTEFSTGRRGTADSGWRATMMSTQTLPTEAQPQDSTATQVTADAKAPLSKALFSKAMCDAITGLRSAVASGGSVLLRG